MSRRKIFELFGSIVIEGMGANTKALTQLNKDIRAANKTLNKMGSDAAKMGKTITKSLTLPILGAASAAVKFGGDFDEAMTNSLAIMGEVSDSMRKDMEQTARDVAKDLNLSAKSMAEAYFFLASAGLDAAQSMAALPKVAAFAKAGNFSLAEATDLLTDAQSALGLSSDNTAEHIENMVMVSDMLISANQNANASAQQFSEALTNKAGIALKLLNKDMSEGLAVLQVYADKGLAKGADAGTQLNIVLRDLQNAAVNNKAAFDAAGVSVFDADGKMRHIADIVEDLDNRLGSMSDEQRRAELLMLGFTSKSVDATSALLGTSDAIREYEDALKDAGGATQEVAEKQLQGFWEQVGKVKTAAIDLGLTLFEYLQPIITDTIIPAINSLIEAVESLFEWFEKHPLIADFVGAFTAALAVMGPLLLMFTKFLPLIKSAFALYKVLTAAQVTLNLVMAANPVGLIVLAIGALIAAGVALVKNWDKIKAGYIIIWDTIKFHFMNIVFTIIKNYSFMILKVLEGISKLGKFLPAVGLAVDFLVEKITAGTEAINAQQEALQANRKEQLAAQKLAKQQADAVKAATDAKKAETEAINDNTDKKKKNNEATLKEIKEAEELAEKREKFESEWTGKLTKHSENRSDQLAIEKQNALSEAESLGADRQSILEYYAKEEEKLKRETAKKSYDISKNLASEQAALIDDDLTRLQTVTAQKLSENEWEKQEAVRIATEKGVDTSNIVELYRAREERIIKEAAVKEQKISSQTKEKRKSDASEVLQAVSSFAGQINSIWQTSIDNRTTEIEQEAEKRKEAIEASTMNEEAKAEAILKIDEETDAKKKEIQKENAIREKASVLFGIAINTALAVVKALPNIPLSIAVGALGIASGIAAAATPLPLAEGGLVQSDPGRGIIAQIGEGDQDELVLPMKTGAAELAKNIIAKMPGLGSDLEPRTTPVPRETHLHIGTLIADEFGLKKLSKMLNKYTVAEKQRTGVANA